MNNNSPDIGILLATAKVLKLKGDEYTASMLEQCAAARRNAQGEREKTLMEVLALPTYGWGPDCIRAEDVRALLTNNPRAEPTKGEPGYKELFSGDYSRNMWDKINSITDPDTIDALYLVCCRIQEMETQLKKLIGGEND